MYTLPIVAAVIIFAWLVLAVKGLISLNKAWYKQKYEIQQLKNENSILKEQRIRYGYAFERANAAFDSDDIELAHTILKAYRDGILGENNATN